MWDNIKNKLILNEKIWTGLIWLRIGFSGDRIVYNDRKDIWKGLLVSKSNNVTDSAVRQIDEIQEHIQDS
jgi:hypothetical protein